jgi:hypothetical protein
MAMPVIRTGNFVVIALSTARHLKASGSAILVNVLSMFADQPQKFGTCGFSGNCFRQWWFAFKWRIPQTV